MKDIALIELCERCETIDFWVDPEPNAQLTLIWLLDHLRHHRETALKLRLVQADAVIGNMPPEELAKRRLAAVNILNHHLETAGAAWQAYRASTPRDWFNLLGWDLGALPQLRQTVVELLEELPWAATGLGATEMRMLELIAAGNAAPFDVFPGHNKPNTRRVFGYWEVGALLDGLAHGPAPALSGLDEGPFTPAMHEDRHRHERYKQSAHRIRQGYLGRHCRFQPPQSGPPVVGRHRIDQRPLMALGPGEPCFDRALTSRRRPGWVHSAAWA
jgi:hypothetical protein